MAGVLNTAPTLTTCVKAASLYQVNTGLVTVVLAAVNTAVPEAHNEVVPVTVTSAAVADGLTVIETFVRVGFVQPAPLTDST
ncbi:hypothetical protein D3C85_754720 [compost metagenome]